MGFWKKAKKTLRVSPKNFGFGAVEAASAGALTASPFLGPLGANAAFLSIPRHIRGKSGAGFEDPEEEELAALGRLTVDPESAAANSLARARLRASGLNDAAAFAAAGRLMSRGLLGRALEAGDAASRLEGLRREYAGRAAGITVKDDAQAFFGA